MMEGVIMWMADRVEPLYETIERSGDLLIVLVMSVWCIVTLLYMEGFIVSVKRPLLHNRFGQVESDLRRTLYRPYSSCRHLCGFLMSLDRPVMGDNGFMMKLGIVVCPGCLLDSID
jgi:hypothetical protein